MPDEVFCYEFLKKGNPRVSEDRPRLKRLGKQLATEVRPDEQLIACIVSMGRTNGESFVLTNRRLIVLEPFSSLSLPPEAIMSVAQGATNPDGIVRTLRLRYYQAVTVTTYGGQTHHVAASEQMYDVASFVTTLQEWLDAARRPAPATAPVPPQPPFAPGWYGDPWQRFALRYWDGTAWTEHVARAETDPAG